MTQPAEDAQLSAAQVKERLAAILQAACQIILGKEEQLRLALCCIITGGHLLIEDLPGMGKTTLAHLLAQILGLHFQRVQFTSDLLPADILGASIYDRENGHFQFCPGPIFSQVVLADEINRATPKCQSALLEAMAEQQVTIEGESHPLPSPFFVIATQNPAHQIGTFPLPESQLDRFLMRLAIGYPDQKAERALLQGEERNRMIGNIKPLLNSQQLLTIQRLVTKVHCADALLDYLQLLLNFSRQSALFVNGLSPRAGLALLRAGKSWALMAGRNHLLPEDIQAVLPAVVGHRLQGAGEQAGSSSDELVEQLAQIPIP